MSVELNGNTSLPRSLAIIPAYNEAHSIEFVVMQIRQSQPDIDVIVIDDGSTDGTAAKVPDEVQLIRLPFNLGIGGAMQTGYRYAWVHGYEVAIQVDADGQHPPNEMGVIVSRLQQGDVDMVIGSRFLDTGTYEQSHSRMAGIHVLRTLLKLLTGKSFTDCTSGFRAVNRRVIESFSHWYPEDYPEPEVVLLLDRAGYRIVEVPVEMKQRASGKSSISFFWGLFYVIKVAMALLLDMVRDPWPASKERNISKDFKVE